MRSRRVKVINILPVKELEQAEVYPRYFWRHLTRLYFGYMKLALAGIVFSSIFFSLWSVSQTNTTARTIVVIFIGVGLFALAFQTFSNVSAKKRRQRQEKAVEAYNQDRKEQAKRQDQRIQAAKNYLAFMDARTISDNKEQTINEQLLIDDIVVMVEQLEEENLDINVIDRAVQRFLTALEETKYSFIFSVRREILSEIVSDTIMKHLVVKK